jgi:hypothetical protein
MSLHSNQGFVVRLWCEKHNVALVNFEGSGLQGVKAIGSASPDDGSWALDLSDFMCPMEITEYMVVDLGLNSDESHAGFGIVGTGSSQPLPILGVYNSEKDAQRVADNLELDECVTRWSIKVWTDGFVNSPGQGWLDPTAREG